MYDTDTANMWDGVDEVADRSDIEWVLQGKLGQVYREGQVGSRSGGEPKWLPITLSIAGANPY